MDILPGTFCIYGERKSRPSQTNADNFIEGQKYGADAPLVPTCTFTSKIQQRKYTEIYSTAST